MDVDGAGPRPPLPWVLGGCPPCTCPLGRLAENAFPIAGGPLDIEQNPLTTPHPPHRNRETSMARVSRLGRELELLRTDPPPGVAAWLVDEADMSRFHASKLG